MEYEVEELGDVKSEWGKEYLGRSKREGSRQLISWSLTKSKSKRGGKVVDVKKLWIITLTVLTSKLMSKTIFIIKKLIYYKNLFIPMKLWTVPCIFFFFFKCLSCSRLPKSTSDKSLSCVFI